MEPTRVTNNDRKLMKATCALDTSINEGNGNGAPTREDIIGKYNIKQYAVIFLLGVSKTLILGLTMLSATTLK